MSQKNDGGVEVYKGFPTIMLNGRRYVLVGRNYRQFDAMPHIWVNETGDVWDDNKKVMLNQKIDKDGRWRVVLKHRLRKYPVLVKKLRLHVHGV